MTGDPLYVVSWRPYPPLGESSVHVHRAWFDHELDAHQYAKELGRPFDGPVEWSIGATA
jgi:hypothetical protein